MVTFYDKRERLFSQKNWRRKKGRRSGQFAEKSWVFWKIRENFFYSKKRFRKNCILKTFSLNFSEKRGKIEKFRYFFGCWLPALAALPQRKLTFPLVIVTIASLSFRVDFITEKFPDRNNNSEKWVIESQYFCTFSVYFQAPRVKGKVALLSPQNLIWSSSLVKIGFEISLVS